MYILSSLLFFLAAVGCFWAAYTGKPFYPGGPGGMRKYPRTPLSSRDGRQMYLLMGLGFLVVAIAPLFHR